MEHGIAGLLIVVAFVAVLFAAFYVYECLRSVWFWTAAKLHGWTPQEKFERETAYLDRAAKREEHRALKDAEALTNTTRRREGAMIVTFAVAFVAGQAGMEWWQVGVLFVATYIGMNMAVGVTLKW
jgi:hypothetical protein